MQNKTTALKNLRILLTRPAQQAEKLSQLIREQQGQPILFPTIEIQYLSSKQQPALKEVRSALVKQDIAIFISANAVWAAAMFMQEEAGEWPTHLTIAAIGNATAQALSEIKLPATLVPAVLFNSEALLALPVLNAIKNKRIIIFKGEGGREWLATVLKERGAIVSEAIVYRRVLPKNDVQPLLANWLTGGLDIIICTSNTGLQNLVTIISETARNWLMSMPLLVISERMALFAQELGFVKKPIVADNATDAAIVQALIKYYPKISHFIAE